MKKICPILILACLLGVRIQSQSFIIAGGSFHPDKIQEPKPFYPFERALEEIREIDHHPGYSFYLGFGKNFNFSDDWSLLGAWQLQFQEYASDGKSRFFERNEPQTLISEGVFKAHLQHASLRTSLLLEKKFPLLNHTWSVFGGGYANFQIEDWTRSDDAGSVYYQVEINQFFDTTCQCLKEILISKSPLNPAYTYDVKRDYDTEGIRPINFGLTGGVSFPLLSSGEGNLRGQVMISQDLKPYFDDWRPGFYQTSITAGLLFEPVKIKQPHLRKPEKRTLSSGIYTGASLHLIFFSVDGMWLSGKNLGIDAAARYALVKFDSGPTGQVYAGAIYRLGNSRFFVKMGGAYTWIEDSEYYDDSRRSFVLGGKYILPFSNFLGMQVNADWLMHKGEKPFPALGIGLLLIPK